MCWPLIMYTSICVVSQHLAYFYPWFTSNFHKVLFQIIFKIINILHRFSQEKVDRAWFQIINFLYIFLYTDIDECQLSARCPLSARCVNTYGSYRCIPSTSCPQGYEIDPVTQTCVGKSAIPLLPAELMNIEHLQSGV